MGKVKKARKSSKRPIGKPTTDSQQTASNGNDSAGSVLARLVPSGDDFDVGSVKSLNSFKNRFGIKRPIAKGDKLKLRKEILRQKIDYLKEQAGVDGKKRRRGKSLASGASSAAEAIGDVEYARDEDEEYAKIEQQQQDKTKGILKRKKRARLMSQNVNLLKGLMAKKKAAQS